jgi:hypothetical protein
MVPSKNERSLQFASESEAATLDSNVPTSPEIVNPEAERVQQAFPVEALAWLTSAPHRIKLLQEEHSEESRDRRPTWEKSR